MTSVAITDAAALVARTAAAPRALPDDWPNRAASRTRDAAGLAWHVQLAGAGPVALLLHGTGAATHSWADLLPLLARRFTVVAPDLPGHGFTARPADERMSIDGMAGDVAALCGALGVAPAVIVGHSAGAAVALALALRADPALRAVVGLNPALEPPNALYRTLLAPLVDPLARTGAAAVLSATLFGRTPMGPAMVRAAGTALPPEQAARYHRLLGDPERAGATLVMMTNWDLPSLVRRLPDVGVPVTLVAPADDPFVAQRGVREVARRLPDVRLVMPGTGGHIVHEHDALMAADVVLDAATRAGVPTAAGSNAPPA